MIRVRQPYKAPKKQQAVDAILHTGELVVPLDQTKALNDHLFKRSTQPLPRRLLKDLQRLITTTPMLK